jgi:hypothetical protein
VSASTSVGSWRKIYEASTFEEPLMSFPDLSSRRIFCELSTSVAELTSDLVIASSASEVLIGS